MAKVLLRVAGVLLAFVFFTLAALHFSSDLRFRAQTWLIDLDSVTERSLVHIVGAPYVIHDASDATTLGVSLAFRLPTRYVRDLRFWHRFKLGQGFAVEATHANAYGITHLLFRPDVKRRELVQSVATKEKVCIGGLSAWVVRVADMQPEPVYLIEGTDYTLTFLTDGSDKWKQAERRC